MNDRALRRIVAVAVFEAFLQHAVVAIAMGRQRFEKMQGRVRFDLAVANLELRTRNLADRRQVVEDPDRPAIGADDEIVVLDDQIAHRHGRAG